MSQLSSQRPRGPAVGRGGERLFGDTSDKKPMRLTGTQTLEGGIVYLTYQPVRDA
jgi:hypothetical protein